MKKYELSYNKNIRDIGGLPTSDGRHIKYGRLYRGGNLARLTEDDIKIVKSFNLTDIVDFRFEEEFIEFGDYPLDGVRMHNAPMLRKDTERTQKGEDGNLLWFVGDHTSGFEHIRKVYSEFPDSEEGISALKKFFEVIMQKDAVTYFHCSQGKDRTGFAAYLLEIALGVSEQDAFEDYMLSNVAMAKRAEALLNSVKYKPFYNEQYKKDLLDVFSVKMEYINASIETMNQKYGGPISFIRDILGVDTDKLKELYLED